MNKFILILIFCCFSELTIAANVCYFNRERMGKKIISGELSHHMIKTDSFKADALVDSSGFVRQLAIQDYDKDVKIVTTPGTQEAQLYYYAASRPQVSMALNCAN